MNYKEQLIPMDIIVVYNPKSLLHKLIKGVTGYKAGHVALYIGDDMIYEAGSKGIIRRKCKNYTNKCKIYLCRYQYLTENIELKIRDYCFKSEGNNYAFTQLFMIWITYTFRLSHVPDVSKKAMICSEFVANAYASADIHLSKKPAHEVVPADILKSDQIWRIKCQ